MKVIFVAIMLFYITGCSGSLLGTNNEPNGQLKSCAGKMEHGDCIIIQ